MAFPQSVGPQLHRVREGLETALDENTRQVVDEAVYRAVKGLKALESSIAVYERPQVRIYINTSPFDESSPVVIRDIFRRYATEHSVYSFHFLNVGGQQAADFIFDLRELTESSPRHLYLTSMRKVTLFLTSSLQQARNLESQQVEPPKPPQESAHRSPFKGMFRQGSTRQAQDDADPGRTSSAAALRSLSSSGRSSASTMSSPQITPRSESPRFRKYRLIFVDSHEEGANVHNKTEFIKFAKIVDSLFTSDLS